MFQENHAETAFVLLLWCNVFYGIYVWHTSATNRNVTLIHLAVLPTELSVPWNGLLRAKPDAMWETCDQITWHILICLEVALQEQRQLVWMGLMTLWGKGVALSFHTQKYPPSSSCRGLEAENNIGYLDRTCTCDCNIELCVFLSLIFLGFSILSTAAQMQHDMLDAYFSRNIFLFNVAAKLGVCSPDTTTNSNPMRTS